METLRWELVRALRDRSMSRDLELMASEEFRDVLALVHGGERNLVSRD